MAGSSTKISFRQLTEKHDCDHAASATIVIILLYGFAQLSGTFGGMHATLANGLTLHNCA
jgi:hypothetical protein